MLSWLFLKGLLLGFSIAAPVGPIGILCIRRTLAYGRLYGFVSGAGTATADAIYGAIAAFGLTAVAAILVHHQTALQILGGVYLLYLGYTIFKARPIQSAVTLTEGSLTAAYLSAFFLTLTNPMTILMFAAIFSGLGLNAIQANNYGAGIMVMGVFAGSLCWWLLLSTLTSKASTRFDLKQLHLINKLSGLIILGFGLAGLLSFLLR
jgi:threonine/homoserine/homoserine lactone efflux protein